MQPVRINAFTATCALGAGRAALLRALHASRTGLRVNDFGREPLSTWIGRVSDIEALALPAEFSAFESRNNRGTV